MHELPTDTGCALHEQGHLVVGYIPRRCGMMLAQCVGTGQIEHDASFYVVYAFSAQSLDKLIKRGEEWIVIHGHNQRTIQGSFAYRAIHQQTAVIGMIGAQMVQRHRRRKQFGTGSRYHGNGVPVAVNILSRSDIVNIDPQTRFFYTRSGFYIMCKAFRKSRIHIGRILGSYVRFLLHRHGVFFDRIAKRRRYGIPYQASQTQGQHPEEYGTTASYILFQTTFFLFSSLLIFSVIYH